MMKYSIFSELSPHEVKTLNELWDKIADLEGPDCRKIKYNIHKQIRSTITKNEFKAFLVVGRRGRGKTTYTLKTTATYYMIYEELSCGEAWQEALMRLAFTARDLIEKIDYYNDIVIWDDAGVWGSTMMWYDPVMRPYLEALLDWFDVARTDLNVLLMSAPNKKKLPPKIRDDEDTILIKINYHGTREKNGMKVKVSNVLAVENQESLWNDKTYRPTIFQDVFTVWLPQPVYDYYRIIRSKYSAYARKRLRKIIDTLEETEDPRLTMLRKKLSIE